MNIVLVGEESAGIQMLGALEKSAHRLVAVMASPSEANSTSASLWKAAQKRGMETWPASLVRDPAFGSQLQAEKVDLVLNIHSLYIIHSNVLNALRVGAFNLHPGPLPKYAGLNAVSWAIFMGEREHGVTVHKISPEIDAGPIAYQSMFPIEENDTALSLSSKCSREGIRLLVRLVTVAAHDPAAIPSIPQDLRQRTYFGPHQPGDGWVSWDWPAQKITNFVRACDYFPFRSPWGLPKTKLGNLEIHITKAATLSQRAAGEPGTVGEVSGTGALVASGDDWVLITRIKLGEREYSPSGIFHAGDRLGNFGLC
jgi:methionyl-tRNA formyltransferase